MRDVIWNNKKRASSYTRVRRIVAVVVVVSVQSGGSEDGAVCGDGGEEMHL
jgi:hypothetical protein